MKYWSCKHLSNFHLLSSPDFSILFVSKYQSQQSKYKWVEKILKSVIVLHLSNLRATHLIMVPLLATTAKPSLSTALTRVMYQKMDTSSTNARKKRPGACSVWKFSGSPLHQEYFVHQWGMISSTTVLKRYWLKKVGWKGGNSKCGHDGLYKMKIRIYSLNIVYCHIELKFLYCWTMWK